MAVTFLVTGASGLIGFKILLTALANGHNVRYTVRSEDKARVVSSNPAVEKLAPGDRLTPVVVPDFTAEGAFDDALKGVTHVIHAGSPVPVPTYDPTTQVFKPTVEIASNILASALKTPSIQRVVITSSIVANVGFVPPETAVTAATRMPLPDPIPSTFDDVFVAYIQAKIVEIHQSENFIKQQNPHFSMVHVIPGYVFGRNELALDASMMQASNSSNNFLMMGMLGGELPFPIHGGYAHIDDVANVHLQVALSSEASKDHAISKKVNYDAIFDIVESAFPKAVAEGIFKRGKVPTLPTEYDTSETEKFMGTSFKSFESAVQDVAAQYLEKLGKEKA